MYILQIALFSSTVKTWLFVLPFLGEVSNGGDELPDSGKSCCVQLGLADVGSGQGGEQLFH